jgi:hypothetical protein
VLFPANAYTVLLPSGSTPSDLSGAAHPFPMGPLPTHSSPGSSNPKASTGQVAPQASHPPPTSTDLHTASPRSRSLGVSHAPKQKPPRPALFEDVGSPISQPEFSYVVYMVMEARNAGLQDDLNDFEEGEERPVEIHRQWMELGCPMTFKAFQTAQKGKACAISPAPPISNSPSKDTPSALGGDELAGVLSEKFGLPPAAIQAFSAKAVARAHRSSNLPKGSSAGPKYKPLKGAAKEEVSTLIDQALNSLLQVSQKHGTDPTAATKLFQKKLDYFSSSLWNMWEIQYAAKREAKGWGEDNSGNEDEDEVEEEGSGDDESPGSDREDGMSMTQINPILFDHLSYIEASGSKGQQAKKDAAGYNREKATALAAGPKVFEAWASQVAAKGYNAITSLKQKSSNDQTRAKAAAEACDSLDAFVSNFFFGLSIIDVLNLA